MVKSKINSIKYAIKKYGPIASSVAVDSHFKYYKKGIFNHSNKLKVNHAVILAGWDDTLGESGCWILKNSWGPRWGENGFMYIEYGKCGVGMAADNLYVVLNQ